MQKLLTITQLSRLSGRSRNTILAWCKNGKISHSLDGSRVLIDLAEAMRVFPDLSGAEIERELSETPKETPSVKAANAQVDASGNAQNRRILELEAEVEKLKFQVEMLNRHIELLERDRSMLEEMRKSDCARFDQMLRLLPVQSSAQTGPVRSIAKSEAARRKERNENGQFTKGKGKAALIADAVPGEEIA